MRRFGLHTERQVVSGDPRGQFRAARSKRSFIELPDQLDGLSPAIGVEAMVPERSFAPAILDDPAKGRDLPRQYVYVGADVMTVVRGAESAIR